MSENEEKGQQTQAVSVPVSMEMLKYKEELATKMGLPSPYGMQLMKEAAQDMVASGLVPKCFSGNPMAVYLAAMRGREMGLSPMESVLETFFPAPGGNLGMYAKKMLQVMHSKGVTSKFTTETAELCEILFTPPPPHEPYTARFSIEEAKQAGLIKPDSNWMKWRTDMNRARAISRGWRALAGTFQGGSAMYSKEELSDVISPESTMDEPTEADRQRAAQLASPMGDFKVALKQTPTVAQEAKPEPLAEVKPEPKVVDVKPEPVAETKPTEPVETFSVKIAMATAGGETKYIPVDGEVQHSTLAEARLRAQALANDSGTEHAVFQNSNGALLVSCKPPAKPAPPAEKVATGKPSVAKARMEALCTKLPDIAPKTAVARFSAFISGYLGIGLKQLGTATPEQATESLDALESVLERDINEFRSGPEEAGKRMKERRDAIMAYVSQAWPKNPDTCLIAYQFNLRAGNSFEGFKQWFEAVGLDFMQQVDAHALLRVFVRTREAAKLVKLKKDFPGLSLAKVVEQIEKRVFPGLSITDKAAVSVSALDSAIAEFVRVAKEQPQPEPPAAEPAPVEPPAAEPPAEEPPAEEDAGEGLFGSSW